MVVRAGLVHSDLIWNLTRVKSLLIIMDGFFMILRVHTSLQYDSIIDRFDSQQVASSSRDFSRVTGKKSPTMINCIIWNVQAGLVSLPLFISCDN